MNFPNVKCVCLRLLVRTTTSGVLVLELVVSMSYAEGASFIQFSLIGRRPMLTGELLYQHISGSPITAVRVFSQCPPWE